MPIGLHSQKTQVESIDRQETLVVCFLLLYSTPWLSRSSVNIFQDGLKLSDLSPFFAHIAFSRSETTLACPAYHHQPKRYRLSLTCASSCTATSLGSGRRIVRGGSLSIRRRLNSRRWMWLVVVSSGPPWFRRLVCSLRTNKSSQESPTRPTASSSGVLIRTGYAQSTSIGNQNTVSIQTMPDASHHLYL